MNSSQFRPDNNVIDSDINKLNQIISEFESFYDGRIFELSTNFWEDTSRWLYDTTVEWSGEKHKLVKDFYREFEIPEEMMIFDWEKPIWEYYDSKQVWATKKIRIKPNYKKDLDEIKWMYEERIQILERDKHIELWVTTCSKNTQQWFKSISVRQSTRWQVTKTLDS